MQVSVLGIKVVAIFFFYPTIGTYRRVKKENSYDLNAQNGYLHLNCLKESIGDRKRYNFTGIKQRETNFELVTIMQFNPTKNGEEAGRLPLRF